MEHIPDLATYGPIGIVCVVQMLVIKTLFSMYVDVQEKRISENNETQKTIQELMAIIREMKHAVRNH